MSDGTIILMKTKQHDVFSITKLHFVWWRCFCEAFSFFCVSCVQVNSVLISTIQINYCKWFEHPMVFFFCKISIIQVNQCFWFCAFRFCFRNWKKIIILFPSLNFLKPKQKKDSVFLQLSLYFRQQLGKVNRHCLGKWTNIVWSSEQNCNT